MTIAEHEIRFRKVWLSLKKLERASQADDLSKEIDSLKVIIRDQSSPATARIIFPQP